VLTFKNIWLEMCSWRGVEFRTEANVDLADMQASKQANKRTTNKLTD